MNKKVLSAILFSALFAGTGTFTSCIDNDEPAGIENLRGAKAELIRAKVAVEAANAAFRLAQAEHEKAEAAIDLAEAKIKEAAAKLVEAKAEKQEIENETARVELDNKIANLEMQMEEAVLAHEKNMLIKQQALAEAKRSYDIALKQIAIAEALMSESQKVAVSTLKSQVNTLMGQIAMVEDAIEAKNEELYHASMYLGAETEYQVTYAEQQLAKAEAKLEANADVIAKYKKYMEVDSTAAESDWRAEVAAIEAEVAEYDKQIAVLKLEATKKQESEECKALAATVKAENDTLTAANKARTDLALGAEVAYTYKFWNGEQNFKESLAKGLDMDEAGELIAGPNFMDAEAEVAGIIEKVNHVYARYTEEFKEYLKAVAKADETGGLAAAKKASDEAVAAWTAAKTAYETSLTTAKDLTTTAAETAYENYEKALAAAGKLEGTTPEQTVAKQAAAVLKAKQNFADALVAWYNTIPADQVAFNNVTLKLVAYKADGSTREYYATKTVKEWLSDADNKDVYLELLLKQFDGKQWALWTTGKQGEFEDIDAATGETVKYATAKYAFNKFVEKAATITDAKKAALVSASKTAFGEALLTVSDKTFEYLTVMPSTNDIKLVGYENAGKYGAYLGYEDAEIVFIAKNYEAILADYAAAITFWTAELTKIQTAITAANNAIKTANADVTAATKAYNKFVAAITADYNAAVSVLNAKVQSLNAVKSALINAVDVYLAENYSGEVNFMDWLAAQVKTYEAKVIDLEYAVAKAEADLKAAEEGHFLTADKVAAVQKDLDNLEDKLADLVDDLNDAVEALATAEEVWAE